MCGFLIFHTWGGPGAEYPYPTDPTADRISSTFKSRWMPFLQKAMAHLITSGSPQNQSGQNWESIHAGVKTEHVSDNVGKM